MHTLLYIIKETEYDIFSPSYKFDIDAKNK